VPRKMPSLTSVANKILRRGSKAVSSRRTCDEIYGYRTGGEKVSISERGAREHTEDEVVSASSLATRLELTQVMQTPDIHPDHAMRLGHR
jgi:hypothetical protein